MPPGVRTMSLWPKVLYVLMTWATFATWAVGSVRVISSQWQTEGQQSVVSCEVQQPGRSLVDCLQRCDRFSHCNQVAFLPPSLTCCLMPTSAGDGPSGNDVMVYRKKDAICSYDKAPVTHATVIWRSKLTSLEGNVTCDSGYVWTTDDANVTCSAKDVWTVDGTCEQYYWELPRNRKTYSLPRQAAEGWKMCVSGCQTSVAASFSVNLFDAQVNRLLKMEVNFGDHSIMTVYHVNGTFAGQKTVQPSPFPFVPFGTFLLDIRAASEFSFEISVNGTVYATHVSPISVTNLLKVVLYGDGGFQWLDLWCA